MERKGTAVVIVLAPEVVACPLIVSAVVITSTITNIKRTNLIIILLKLSVANIRIETDATIILK
jgi:hypothetical protein